MLVRLSFLHVLRVGRLLAQLKRVKKPLTETLFISSITIMTESQRLEFIANAVASAKKVAPQFQGLLDELKAEKLAEDLVLEHGTQHASKEDIEQEFVSLDAVESDKDDIDEDDENIVDMDFVSESMREIFTS